MINRIQAAADCLAAAKLLYKRHLVNAYEGNVSIRVGDSIFITPTQICKELLTPDDLVEVDIASGAVIRAGKGRKPSSELKLHLCCYRNRGDAQAVAHAHPPYATSFALRCEPIETRGYPELMLHYGRVPVCRYGRASTEAVNADVPAVLQEYDAFLLANHGLAAVAATALDAGLVKDGRVGLLSAMVAAKLCGSNREARQLIQQGGVLVDGEKAADPKYTIDEETLRRGVIIRKGKKVYKKITLEG